MLYSIVETAKANGLILYDYLVKCMQELAKAETDIDALLPWNNNIAPWVHGADTFKKRCFLRLLLNMGSS